MREAVAFDPALIGESFHRFIKVPQFALFNRCAVSCPIPHCIFSGPFGSQCFYELQCLLKLAARRNALPFAVPKLFEYSEHPSSTRSAGLIWFRKVLVLVYVWL